MLITRHRAGLCVAALLGTASLLRLVERVEQQSIELPFRPLNFVRSEVVAIYAPARIIAFAESNGPFETNDELARAISEANLEGSWFGIDIDDTMEDGSSYINKQFIRPGEHVYLLSMATSVLAALAGRPPCFPTLDYGTAEIFVIDESYMKRDPFESMRELEEFRLAARSSHSSVGRRLGLRKVTLGMEF